MQIIPSGPGYRYENNLLFFVSIISTAKKSVLITNPYLVPSEPLLTALTAASIRGVKVSILNSEAMDQWMVGHAQRSYYEEFLRAGVNIHLYKKPHLVHEKYISVDNEIAVVGSSNLDIRSFALNDECTLVAYDSKTASTLAKHHQDMLKNSTQLSLKAWLSRPVRKTLLDSIARLTSALQ